MPKSTSNGSGQPNNQAPKRVNQDPVLSLWKTHRQDSVFFQREVQVNFWTILGGLALGALLTQLSPLLKEIQNSRWYLVLFLVSSVLIVANAWVQTSWASLVLKWPISIITTVINLFSLLTQSTQSLLVTKPAGWMAATGFYLFFAVLMQVYFQHSGSWDVFPASRIKQIKINNLVYILLMLICFSAALQMYLLPSQISEMIWGFVTLILTILALYMEHIGMQEERRILGIP